MQLPTTKWVSLETHPRKAHPLETHPVCWKAFPPKSDPPQNASDAKELASGVATPGGRKEPDACVRLRHIEGGYLDQSSWFVTPLDVGLPLEPRVVGLVR